MTRPPDTSVHASAVKIGERAVLIRGPSGSGKSRLAFELIMSGPSWQLPQVFLVGDDRVYLDTAGGELLVRPAPQLAGLIEIRGLGIRRMDYVPQAVVGLVVDLTANDAERLPTDNALQTSIFGVKIPRIPIGSGFSPLPLVVAALTTTTSSSSASHSDYCRKGIGNHISATIATE